MMDLDFISTGGEVLKIFKHCLGSWAVMSCVAGSTEWQLETTQ